MNISVSDDLAAQVRQRKIPISAICQRALRDEVDRLRVLEDAGELVTVRRDDLVALLDAADMDYVQTRNLPDLEDRVERLTAVVQDTEP